jgi:hypothetical protein
MIFSSNWSADTILYYTFFFLKFKIINVDIDNSKPVSVVGRYERE